MKIHSILSTAALALALAACGSSTATAPTSSTAATAGASAADVKAGAISISGPWARASQMSGGMGSMATAEAGGMGSMATAEAGGMGGMSSMDGGMGAAYMVIANSGSAADKLLSVTTDAAKTAEIHTVKEENGVMSMRPVEGGLEIPAGGSVELKPGSFHVMLIGLAKPLVAGESITLKLTFATAGEVTVTAPIREK